MAQPLSPKPLPAGTNYPSSLALEGVTNDKDIYLGLRANSRAPGRTPDPLDTQACTLLWCPRPRHMLPVHDAELIKLRSHRESITPSPPYPTAPDAKSYVAVSHSSIPHTPAPHAAVSQTEVPQNATHHNAGSHRAVSHGVASHDAVHPIIVSHTMDSRTANSQAAFCSTARSHLHV